MINTLTTLYSSLKSYYNNLIVYGHSYENRKLVILKGVLDVIKELRCYSYTSNQDITDIYSIVEYIVNSSDIFKKEYAPTNNITNYFQDVPSQFYPKGEYNIKESLVTVIANTTAFKYDGEGQVFPNEINLQAVAYNFTPSTSAVRKWEYSNGSTYKVIEGATSDNLTVTPDSELWNNTDMISLRYTVNDIYTNQLTIFKVRDGYGAYSVEITSSNGNIFQNNRIDTELSTHVYIAGSDITDTIPAEEFSWKRISDDPTSDTQWNNKNLKGKTIRITNKDVKKKATFICTVVIDGAKIMNGQITIVDQLDTTYISATLESNKSLVQLYNTEDGKLNPDWTVYPYLVLTPGVWSGDPNDNLLISQKENIKDFKWTKNGLSIENSPTHVIDENQVLTIKTNELTLNPNIRYGFYGIYVDPLTKAETPFYSSLSFVRVETSGVTIQAIMLYPLGSIFKNDDVDFLKAHCDLWRGSYIDDTDVEYKWFIEKPGVFDPKFTSTAAKTGDNVLHLDNTTGMVRDSNIRILGYDYVVATVNSSTTIVLTETLKQDVPSGTRIYNPYYNSSGGIGWAYIDEVNNFGVTGYTTNEITIPESTVLNFATFKCVITDLDSKSITYNQSVYATASFLDQQDPLQIAFDTPEGTIFKNKTGTITITAEVWRNGEELDEDGSTYIYDWIQYDKNGQVIPTFSRINKTILITPDDVDSKSNFEVRLKNSLGQIVAKGRITIVDIIDGSNSIIIYTRDMLEPSQPTGSSPAGWNVNPNYFDEWWGLLWQAFNINSLTGEPSGEWTPPLLVDEYTTNMFFRFLWNEGTGDYSKYLQYGTNANNEREILPTPFNMPDVVWKCISTADGDIDGGFYVPNIPIYHHITYRYSVWVKQMQRDGNILFGCDPNTLLYTGQSSDGLFWGGDVPQLNKWYLLVGYINSSEDNTGEKTDAGIYDPETGKKASDTAKFRTFKSRKTDETQMFRAYQGSALGIGAEVQFWGHRLDLCNNKEPSISELLKQTAIGTPARGVEIQGDTVFKYKDDFKGDPVPNVIDLVVSTQNILEPTYVWRYRNSESEWITMGNDTNEFTVNPNDASAGWEPGITYVTYRVDVGDYFDTHTIVKVTDGINGEDGWYTDFKYAVSIDTPVIQYPSGESPGDQWVDNPPQPTGEQGLWMTQILKYPSTGKVKEGETWSNPVKISGDRGDDAYSVIADKEYHDLLVLTDTKNTINPKYFKLPTEEEGGLALTVATTYTVLEGTIPLTYKANGGTTPGINYYSISDIECEEGLSVEVTNRGQVYPTAFDTSKANLSCKLRIYCEDSGINFLKVITWRKINEENWYLEDALGGVTVTDGGLFLTTWIRLGHAKKKNDFEYELTDEKAGIYGGSNLPGEYFPQTVRFYSGGNYTSAQEWSNLYQNFLNTINNPDIPEEDKKLARKNFWEYDPRSQSPQGATFVIREDGQMLCYGGYFHGDIWAENGYFKGKIEADEGYFKGTLTATTGTIGGLNIYEDGFGIKGGNFYVDSEGNLTAKNGTFEGLITATQGSSFGRLFLTNRAVYVTENDDWHQSGHISLMGNYKFDSSSTWNFGIGVGNKNYSSSIDTPNIASWSHFIGYNGTSPWAQLNTLNVVGEYCDIDCQLNVAGNFALTGTASHYFTSANESWTPPYEDYSIWICEGTASGKKQIVIPTGLPKGTIKFAISNATTGQFAIIAGNGEKLVNVGKDYSWLLMDNPGDSVMLVKISSYQWACFPTIFTKGSFGN